MTVMEHAQGRHIGDILKERNIEIIGADPVTRHGFTQVPPEPVNLRHLYLFGDAPQPWEYCGRSGEPRKVGCPHALWSGREDAIGR
jgi:hypothetical protein